MAASALWIDPVRRSCSQSTRNRTTLSIVWSVATTANRVASYKALSAARARDHFQNGGRRHLGFLKKKQNKKATFVCNLWGRMTRSAGWIIIWTLLNLSADWKPYTQQYYVVELVACRRAVFFVNIVQRRRRRTLAAAADASRRRSGGTARVCVVFTHARSPCLPPLWPPTGLSAPGCLFLDGRTSTMHCSVNASTVVEPI